jgi:8-oxo-dGTP pyrophosphatase MutT (NUDIX family)
MSKTRESVRWLIVKKDEGGKSVILIHRIKNWKEYRVLPWGWIEEGEKPEDTLYREISEELWNIEIKWRGFISKIKVNIWDVLNYEHIYLWEYIRWDINSWSWVEYTKRSNSNNYYNPELIKRDDVKNKDILPEETKKLIIDTLNS